MAYATFEKFEEDGVELPMTRCSIRYPNDQMGAAIEHTRLWLKENPESGAVTIFLDDGQ